MTLHGIVLSGTGAGSRIGYPTANIVLDKTYPFLREGVYCAWTWIDGKKYPSALAAQISKSSILVHLIDYTGPDFLGEEIMVDVIQQISQIEEYESEEELKKKISQDIEIAKKILCP